MKPRSRTRVDDVGRRALALWAALLWIAGFELMPDLHIGLHGRLGAHSHDAAVAEHAHGHEHEHEHEHEHGHEHGHEHDDHGHADEFADAGPAGEAFHSDADDARGHAVASTLDLDHGRHDLLHRGIAVIQPPDVLPALAHAHISWLGRVRAADDQLRSRAVLHARARGPPVAITCRPVDCTA